MKVIFTTLFLFCIVSSSSCLTYEEGATDGFFNVLNYGAVGDGRHDASQPFLRAWRDVCGATGATPTLLIPAGTTFLLKPISFQGPCRSSRINIQLSGTLVAPYGMSGWSGQSRWIEFSEITGLTVNGGGQVDGRGYAWWGRVGEGSRPTALYFHSCNGLVIRGTRHVNSPRNHISINGCQGVDISHLAILAPEDSPNTDGIDISASTNVNIHTCKIATGDDCIAINGFSSHINISRIFCGPGHGISIGSLGKNGAYETVEKVRVRSCTFKGTQNGVRIKTWQGGSGYVSKVRFENILLIDTENPIIINQRYVNNLVNGYNSDIKISDITYRNIHGTSAKEQAISLYCSGNPACTNIVLNNVHISSSKSGQQTYAICKNVYGKIASSLPIVPCLNKVSSLW